MIILASLVEVNLHIIPAVYLFLEVEIHFSGDL